LARPRADGTIRRALDAAGLRTAEMTPPEPRRESVADQQLAGPSAGESGEKLCGDEACEEGIIPSGDFAAETQGIFTN